MPSSLRFAGLCLLLVGCSDSDPGARATSESLGMTVGGSLGSTSADSASATATSGGTTESDDSSSGQREDSTGPACSDGPPQLVGPLEAVDYGDGETSVTVELEFDREVTIEAGGLSVDGGASVTQPELPITATTVSVVVEDLVGPGRSTLVVDASSVTDACERRPEEDVVVPLSRDCADNTAPRSTTVEFRQLPDGTLTDTYTLTFDEPVTLGVGAIAIVSGEATLDAITPILPATSDTFSVELSDLGAIERLRVRADQVTDGCGANLEADVDLWVCATTSLSVGYSGAAEDFVVPACAQGSVTLLALGAQGADPGGGALGGRGGEAVGELAVMTADTLRLRVGGQSGFNGGGSGGSGDPTTSGNGGGASDVRYGGDTLGDRVLVAGGGGGGAATAQGSCGPAPGAPGGDGGGNAGATGTEGPGCTGFVGPGGGASQVTGGIGGSSVANCSEMPMVAESGTVGVGGDGSDGIDCNDAGLTGGGGGGGGGGYYGGGGGSGGPGGGTGSWGGAGGGGGSSYLGGVTGGSTTSGVRSGDGQIIVSW